MRYELIREVFYICYTKTILYKDNYILFNKMLKQVNNVLKFVMIVISETYLGITTESIAWITPLDASTSVITTVEVPPFSSVKITFPSFKDAVIIPP